MTILPQGIQVAGPCRPLQASPWREEILQARKHPRVRASMRCWCESDTTTVVAQLGNLSEGGAFVQTYAPLAGGDEARLRFALEAGSFLELKTRVAWRRTDAAAGRGPGMGLRFEGLSPEDAARLRAWIATQRS